MPISVKTMRDIWDEAKGERKEIENIRIFPPEIERYYLEYLARKQTFLEIKDEIAQIFADYESHLGEAGFSKS